MLSLKICGGIIIINIQLDFSMIYDYDISKFCPWLLFFFFFLIEFIIDLSKLKIKTYPYFPSHMELLFFPYSVHQRGSSCLCLMQNALI